MSAAGQARAAARLARISDRDTKKLLGRGGLVAYPVGGLAGLAGHI